MNKPPASETYLTVRQHADALAKECYGEYWGLYRNEPLDQLFAAIWRDEFGDEAERCLLIYDEDKRKGMAPSHQSPARVLLYQHLPKRDYWIPDTIHEARKGEFYWGVMAGLHWDDYDPHWRRRIMEQVAILTACRNW